MSKPCVQWFLECSNETNANNCFNGIKTALLTVSSVYENKLNKNIHNKGYVDRIGKWVDGGIHRMSSNTEKNTLVNVIRGLSNPPHITGKVSWHNCTHLQWKCLDCSHTWDSEEIPPTFCPSCGNSNPVSIISDAQPCTIEEEWVL